MTTAKRINDLTIEAMETWWDGAAAYQKQSGEFFQQWLKGVNAAQETTRDLSLKLVKQGQQAQSLWQEWAQEAYRANVDFVASAAQTQLKEVSERVESLNRQTNGASKKAETAATK